MMNNKKHPVLAVLKLIRYNCPLYYAVMLFKILVMSVQPFVNIWFPKQIIELLTEKSGYEMILLVVFEYAAALLVCRFLDNHLTHTEVLMTYDLKSRLETSVGEKAMKTGLWNIESAVYKDEIKMAENVNDVFKLAETIRKIIASSITILGVILIVATFDLSFVLIISAVIAVRIIFSIIRFKRRRKDKIEEAENDKIGGYLEHIQYRSEGGEKEIRVNYLYDWFYDKIKDFRDTMVNIQVRGFKLYSAFESAGVVIGAVQNAFILIKLAGYCVRKVITIADLTMNFNAISVLTDSLTTVVEQVMELNTQIVNIRDYTKLFVDDEGADTDKKCEISGPLSEIRIEHVSFKYPGAEKNVLTDINMTIEKGSHVALVGFNGAGKTTLVKLICKFYRPTSGHILLNGVDIWEIENDKYYDMLSAVFQDFALLQFTIRENVEMNDTGADVSEYLEKAGIYRKVQELPNASETYISRLFSDDGIEMSGGEKQKLAIARALYKNSDLMILDEPTANLDVRSEHEIYTKFKQMTKGKTAIIISHRLSMANACDKVYVLKDGKIEEEGSHSALMEKGGVYSEMYLKQSEAYTGE